MNRQAKPVALLWTVVALAMTPTTARAVPTLSIDLDTLTPGVQSSRTVLLGDSVEAGVVLTGDGTTGFDTLIFDLLFNSGPTIIDVAPGGGPTAGALAATSAFVLDVFGVAPVPLLPGSALAPATPGAIDGLGGVGMTSLVAPFPTVGAGVDVTVALLTFATLGAGQTSLTLGPVIPGDSIFAFFGGPIDVTLETAQLTVRDAQNAPEPHGVLLLLTGVLALVPNLRARR